MPIKIRCACGNVLLAPEDRVGDTGKCPACNRSIKVEMPRSSDTRKLLPQPENTAKEDTSKYFMLKRKPSWIRRILSFPVYALFLLLVLFMISSQYLQEGEVKRLCNLYIPQEAWLQEQILFIRKSHRDFFLTQIYCPLAAYYKKITQQESEKTHQETKPETPRKEHSVPEESLKKQENEKIENIEKEPVKEEIKEETPLKEEVPEKKE